MERRNLCFLACFSVCMLGACGETIRDDGSGGSAGTVGSGQTGSPGGVGGGSAGSEGELLPPRDPALRFSPVHGTTALDGNVRPALVLERGDNRPLDADVIDELRDAATLTTWPERRTVPFEASAAGVADERITLSPTTSLEAGWYAVILDHVPDGIRWPHFAARLEAVSAEDIALFRVGSEPYLWSLRICEKDGSPAVTLDFSELVHAGTDSVRAELRYASGESPGCVFDREAFALSAGESLRLLCDDLDSTQELVVEIHNLVGVDGSSVRAIDARELGLPSEGTNPMIATLRSATRFELADGCIRYTP